MTDFIDDEKLGKLGYTRETEARIIATDRVLKSIKYGLKNELKKEE